MARAPSNDSEPAALVSAKIGSLTRQLRVDDIRLVAACENYTEVTLAESPRLLVRRTLQQWAALLPAAQFARVHRGLLLNLDALGRVERGPQQSARLHFAGDALPPLEVKRRHWPALRLSLEAWRTARQSAPRPPEAEKSIAVLPFANLSRDPANEIFCDGVSEELLNVLAKVPSLRVAARTSAFYFKGRNVPVVEIARQLGVAFVVEGSVRRSGTRVRITAQLIGADDGFHRWSDNFDRELTDLFAVQDEIAGRIAANLQLQLGRPARAATAVNPDAHGLALEGRHFWNARTHDGLTRAEKAFVDALAIAPDFARAHAGLADVYVIRAIYRLADGEPTAADDLQRARMTARRALELDPHLAEPHATLGFVSFHEGRLDEAERPFPAAFASNPNYATGYQFYAWTLAALGRFERALASYDQAIRLDPLSFINVDRYAAMLALAGQFPTALAMSERAAMLRPDLFVGNLSQRAPILLALGRTDEAVAVAREVRTLARDTPFRRNSDADAVFVLRQAGLIGEAADYAAEVLARLPADNHLRGFVLAALGRFEEAIANLGRTPTIMLPFLYWSELWAPARALPAFDDLIARLGRSGEYRTARASWDRMHSNADSPAQPRHRPTTGM